MAQRNYEVKLLRIAEEDLNEIAEYVSTDSPASADKLLDRFENAFANLSRHPYIGKAPNESELARLGYRYVVLGNYLIFYKIEQETVLVYRIIHGARDYKKII